MTVFEAQNPVSSTGYEKIYKKNHKLKIKKMANNTAKDISHIVKFDGTNFPSWKCAVWILLERYQFSA